MQRHVLYFGEINSSQAEVWRKAIEVFDADAGSSRTLALFLEDSLRGRGDRTPSAGAAANFANAPASTATVGRLLVGGPVVARAATRPVLGGALAGELEANALGPRSASSGRLHGRLNPAASGGCIATGSARPPWPISWARTSDWCKRTSSMPATISCSPTRTRCSRIWMALARSVQRQFRRAAVRSDQHLLRGQRLRFARGRQAPPRLQPRTSGRMPSNR